MSLITCPCSPPSRRRIQRQVLVIGCRAPFRWNENMFHNIERVLKGKGLVRPTLRRSRRVAPFSHFAAIYLYYLTLHTTALSFTKGISRTFIQLIGVWKLKLSPIIKGIFLVRWMVLLDEELRSWIGHEHARAVTPQPLHSFCQRSNATHLHFHFT